MKLILEERESRVLREYLVVRSPPITSRVATVEVTRAIARVTTPSADALAELWRRTEFVELDAEIAQSAGGIGPPALRSLDAIHLASALALAEELEAFVTYDARLADAARALGLTVVAPA